MIERHGGVYIPICDSCGMELEEEWEWQDAVNAMKSAGWSFEAPSQSGRPTWEHYCPNCKGEWMFHDS